MSVLTITVKQLKEALQKVSDEDEVVYIEAGFGDPDIHVCYSVKQLENGRVILFGDGHCATEDREGTDFDFDIPAKELI